MKSDSAPATSRAESVSLADIQTARIPLEWFEVIAVVQAVCRVIFNAGDHAGPAKLGLADVVIDSSGRVRVLLDKSTDGPAAVRHILNITRTLLADGAAPAPLRLIVTQEPPVFSNLDQFHADLKRFERPNGSTLVRDIYQRWARARENPETTPAPPRHANSATEQKPDPAARTAQRGRRAYAVAVLATAVLVASAIAWVSRSGDGSIFSSQPRSISGAARVVASAATAATDKLLDRLLPPPSQRAGESEETNASASPPKVVRRPTRTRLPAWLPEPRSASIVEFVPLARSTPAELSSPVALSSLSDGPGEPNERAIIYSASDADVVPPAPIYPQFPSERPDGNPVVELDVLVSESGAVEFVKAHRNPETLGEAMIVTTSLSNSKTWRFVPATRAGRPVKYRKLVWVTAN